MTVFIFDLSQQFCCSALSAAKRTSAVVFDIPRGIGSEVRQMDVPIVPVAFAFHQERIDGIKRDSRDDLQNVFYRRCPAWGLAFGQTVRKKATETGLAGLPGRGHCLVPQRNRRRLRRRECPISGRIRKSPPSPDCCPRRRQRHRRVNRVSACRVHRRPIRRTRVPGPDI